MPGSATPSRWLTVARLGTAHWFFGNLYEALVGVPELLLDAQDQRPPGLLGPGSPLRYYAPAAPITFGATALALVADRRAGGDRTPIAVAATSTTAAVALSTYLIARFNTRLLRPAAPLSPTERRRLVRSWHRTNALRLVALGVASEALRRMALSAPTP